MKSLDIYRVEARALDVALSAAIWAVRAAVLTKHTATDAGVRVARVGGAIAHGVAVGVTKAKGWVE